MIQLHNRNVVDPFKPNTPTREDKLVALTYLLFMKNKRDGMIKVHICCDGRGKRSYMTKEETSYPAVSLEYLMFSCVIDAMEIIYMDTVDIPGECMQKNTEGKFKIRIQGAIAEILVKINPDKYTVKVVIEGVNKVIYAVLLKSLNGALVEIFLFWKYLAKKIAGWAFETNQYDTCVFNKEVDGKQFCYHPPYNRYSIKYRYFSHDSER